jgi:hypothetical protein
MGLIYSSWLTGSLSFQVHGWRGQVRSRIIVAEHHRWHLKQIIRNPVGSELLASDADEPKWEVGPINDTQERLVSLKVAAIAALTGCLAALPLLLATGISNSYNGQWVFSTETLAFSLFLFGATYR